VVLPERLKRPYLMKDFDGPFASINAYQSAGASTARVIIQLRAAGTPEPIVQQEGATLMVIPAGDAPGSVPGPQMAQQEMAPAAEPSIEVDDQSWTESFDVRRASQDEKALGARTLDEFLTGSSIFYGREISIEVRDADIRDVLALIASESGINMVISEEVTGKLSLKLRRVPWDQALITVMRARNLGYIRQGSVIRISSLANLQQESAAAKSIMESQKALAPLRVKVIPVSYARVEDMVEQVQVFLTKDRGKVVADIRTSSLIITDTDDVLRRVEGLIKDLDTAPAQVLIEGRVVEASESFQRQIGINWGYDGVPVQILASGGVGGAPVNLLSSLNSTPVPPAAIQESPLSMGLRIGQLPLFGNLDARLSLAETDTLVRVLSSPRVVAMNKEKAQITQKGENVTFSTVVDSQGQSTRSVVRTPVVVELAVTPQITSDGSIIMDVEIKREFAGPLLDAESLAREINSRSATTKVLVRNGETAVIGGLYQSDQLQSDTGIPWLKEIPIFGWLFKARNMEKTKNELLVFLTPRILNLQNQFSPRGAMGENGFDQGF
jgi:type IV pilus assembly protein PilQ